MTLLSSWSLVYLEVLWQSWTYTPMIPMKLTLPIYPCTDVSIYQLQFSCLNLFYKCSILFYVIVLFSDKQ